MPNSKTQSISFRSILRKEAKNTSIYTLSTFLTGLGSFLIVPLFWKKLTPVDYGVIAVTDIAGAIIGMFLGLSLDASITRFYYEWPEAERSRRIGFLWMLNWSSHIILGAPLIYILSLTTCILFPGVKFYPFVFLGLIGHILVCLHAVPLATIRIKKLPLLYSLYSLTIFFGRMGLSIYFVIIVEKGLHGYFIGNIISGVATVIAGAIIMSRFSTFSFQGIDLNESLKFSLPLIPANMISTATVSLDRFILQQCTSLEVVGIYAISSKFANLIVLLHSALKLSYVPFLVETVSKKLQRGVYDIAQMSLFYLLPILVLGITISAYIQDFVKFINRPEYFSVIQWVPWLTGAAIVSTFNIYFTPGLFLSKKTDKMWIPRLIQLLSILLVGLLLIPKYNLEGIVITRYFSIISFFGVSLVLSEKYFPIPFDWKKLIYLVIITILSVYISRLLEFNNLFANVLSKGSLVMVFGLICVAIIIGFRKPNLTI